MSSENISGVRDGQWVSSSLYSSSNQTHKSSIYSGSATSLPKVENLKTELDQEDYERKSDKARNISRSLMIASSFMGSVATLFAATGLALVISEIPLTAAMGVGVIEIALGAGFLVATALVGLIALAFAGAAIYARDVSDKHRRNAEKLKPNN